MKINRVQLISMHNINCTLIICSNDINNIMHNDNIGDSMYVQDINHLFQLENNAGKSGSPIGCSAPVIFLRALDMSLACKPICWSVMSPSSSARGTRANKMMLVLLLMVILMLRSDGMESD
jgi:hypothetical protein